MLNRIFKSVSNGEIIKVVEFNEKSKQCIVELENGKTRAYQSATLKDKRKFTPVEESGDEYVKEVMQQKKDLGIECPKIESFEVVEELSDEQYAQIGKEIAEQAKAKAKDHKLVPMPGIERLEDLKNEITNDYAKSKVRKSLRLKEVTYKGETKSIREWAEITGMPWKTLYNRINNNGWPVDLAIETPIGERKPR